jgi:anti-sigma factor RsiW
MAERVMTCEEAAPLLDAFVDAELEGTALIDVARHAASCGSCDTSLQELISLHETLGRHGRADADSVDLSGLWTALEPQLKRVDARRAWRRRLRSSSPLWGGLAIAASALLFLSGPQTEPGKSKVTEIVRRPNQAVIERIDSEGGRFELRRERKNGTTLIMVSATGDDLP